MKVAPIIILFFLSKLTTVVTAQQKEAWINKPIADWPAIALMNEVEYKNGDRYVHSSFKYAGTGFLINTGVDTLAVTGKHILWIAKNNRSRFTMVNKLYRTETG